MSQLIYLCRHADYDADQNLTNDGIDQAKALGAYLAGRAPNPIFVTSTQKRTIKTADIVAKIMGAGLTPDNHYSFDSLCELFIREIELIQPRYPLKQVNAFPNAEEAARIVRSRLEEVGRRHPDQDLVAILHGNINAALLYEGRGRESCVSEYHMEYCDAWVLEREGSRIRPVAHIPNELMCALKTETSKKMPEDRLSDGFE